MSHAAMAASGIGLLASAAMVAGPPPARAQADTVAIGSQLRVANTDGEALNLRAGPASTETIVAQLAPDQVVTVIGAPQIVGTTRWLPVSTAANQIGWISDEYAVPVLAAAPPPPPSPTPELALMETPVPSPEPLTASMQALTPTEATQPTGGSLEVEAKVKFPEAKGRHQEIAVWISRNGRPVQDVDVTMFIPDDEDQEPRTFKPTDEEGRTVREYTFGRTKGSVNVTISAVAPDGGKGRTEVSYFVR